MQGTAFVTQLMQDGFHSFRLQILDVQPHFGVLQNLKAAFCRRHMTRKGVLLAHHKKACNGGIHAVSEGSNEAKSLEQFCIVQIQQRSVGIGQASDEPAKTAYFYRIEILHACI